MEECAHPNILEDSRTPVSILPSPRTNTLVSESLFRSHSSHATVSPIDTPHKSYSVSHCTYRGPHRAQCKPPVCTLKWCVLLGSGRPDPSGLGRACDERAQQPDGHQNPLREHRDVDPPPRGDVPRPHARRYLHVSTPHCWLAGVLRTVQPLAADRATALACIV